MKRLGSIFVSLLFVFLFVACSNQDVAADSYYVAIDINPSIEFIVDDEDLVESYQLLNEDAEIITSGVDFIGMNIDEAVELFINLATEAGYIDVAADDNAVLITVLGNEDQVDVESIRERLRQRIGRYFIRNYIQGEILTEDFTREDLIQQAEELGVTPGKLSLALLIMNTDTTEVYVLEDLLELPVKDLTEIIKLYHEDALQAYTEAQIQEFQQRKETIMEQHREQFENWVNEHPELTDEEIDQLWMQYQNRIQRITRARWMERLQEWRQQQIDPSQDDTSEPESDSTSVS